jgi:hypothetical protein
MFQGCISIVFKSVCSSHSRVIKKDSAVLSRAIEVQHQIDLRYSNAMQDVLFRDGNAFMTNEAFQVGDAFMTIDDIKSYALERDQDTLLRYIRADRTLTRSTFLVLGVAFAMFLPAVSAVIQGRISWGDRSSMLPIAIIVFFAFVLVMLFRPNRPKFCLSMVDREFRSLRYKSTQQQNVLDAFSALEQAIDSHYQKYPQAERPRMLSGTF